MWLKATNRAAALLLVLLMLFAALPSWIFAEEAEYILTASVDGAQSTFGSVQAEFTGNVTQEGAITASSYMLTATENENYHFVEWKIGGVAVSTDNPYTVSVSESTDCVAVFAQNSTDSGNTAPKLQETVSETAEAVASVGVAYKLSLNSIFTDSEGDALSYQVKIGEGEYTAAAADYSFTPADSGVTVLTFKANDGVLDSETTYALSLYANKTAQLWSESAQAYLISSVADLKIFREALLNRMSFEGKDVYLMNDITLSDGADVGSAGNVPNDSEVCIFKGRFSGRGHIIENWTNNAEALILRIGPDASVSDLRMQVNVSSSTLGSAITYYNEGKITRCEISGSVSGSSSKYGGIVYTNASGGNISDCLVSVVIASSKSATSAIAAGVASTNNGTISNCVYVGNLTITKGKLYPISPKGLSSCYYLENTSYKTVTGATSCTEEELKLQATYVGFDFDSVWSIDSLQNNGYPSLKYSFGELAEKQKIYVDIEVSVEDYTYKAGDGPSSCYFPLSFDIKYAGDNKAIAENFANLKSTYNLSTSLREANWERDFAVKVPIEGVEQSFSALRAADYFDFAFTINNAYEFIVNKAKFVDSSGTFHNDPEADNSLSALEKSELIAKAQTAVKAILDQIAATFGTESMKNPFFVFTCARANYYPAGMTKDAMYNALSTVWQQYLDYKISNSDKQETTETAKFVLAVTALGYDATEFEGHNLITELMESDDNGKYFASHYQAYALYSGRYGDYQKIAKSLTKNMTGVSKEGSYNADDMQTMYAQPFFLLYDPNATAEDAEAYAIKTYVEGELTDWMQNSMTGFGNFYSTYTNSAANVWTDAQAQILIGLLKMDFLSEGFVKNGITMLDYICAKPELSLGYSGDESQCARALVALIRSYNNEADLFDCTDVEGVAIVEDMIERLSDNIDSAQNRTDIFSALSAYNKLTEAQRTRVDNYKKLSDLVDELTRLIAQEDVEALINALPASEAIKLSDKAKVEAAKAAYEELGSLKSGISKSCVEKLNSCVAAIEEIVSSYTQKTDEAYKATGKWLYENVTSPVPASTGGEWVVIGLNRSDYGISEAYNGIYVANLIEKLNASNGVLNVNNYTEYSRAVLALTAMGYDVGDVGGYNLLEPLADYNKVANQGINGLIWALIAFDSHDYSIPQKVAGDVQTTRDKLIEAILDKELVDGGWALTGTAADVDITAMAIQALSPYYETSTEVKSAVDRGLAVLSAKQNDDASFNSMGSKNSESISQVLTALTAMGIDPLSDERFIKGSRSVLDSLLDYYTGEGNFKHIASGNADPMATEQAYYALSAYYRLINAKTSLYDMSDVELNTAASRVQKAIAAIGEVSLNKEDAIKAARVSYNALNDNQKAQVQNFSLLTAAENSLSALKIAKAQELITAIGEKVELNSEEKITEARNFYNTLSEAEGEKVSNYQKLIDAEAALEKLKNTQQPGGSTKSVRIVIKGLTYTVSEETAQVMKAIDTLLGDLNFPEDAQDFTEGQIKAVTAIYKKYMELSDDDKLFVANYDMLDEVTKKIGKLNHSDEESGIFVEELEWYIKLNVLPAEFSEEEILSIKEKLGEKSGLLAVYDIFFTDTLTGEIFHPQSVVSVKVALPELDGYESLAVAHIDDDGKLEFIQGRITDNDICFEGDSFSRYALAGFMGTWEEMLLPNQKAGLNWLWLMLMGVGIAGAAALLLIKRAQTKQRT